MKLLLTITLLVSGLTFAQGGPPEDLSVPKGENQTVEPKGDCEPGAEGCESGPKLHAYGLDEEFDNNMPEEVKAKVEALRALAEEKREAMQAMQDLSDEEKAEKMEALRDEIHAKRAEILGQLPGEKKEKVEKALNEKEKEEKEANEAKEQAQQRKREQKGKQQQEEEE